MAPPASCVVCQDDEFTLLDGVSCSAWPRPHFVCHSCFSGHVASEAERQVFDGHIRCPMASAAFGQGERCGAPPYPVAVVAQHAQDTFEGFDQRRRLLQEGRLVQELQAEFKHRLEQEIARALAQGQVDQARRHIQDRILTLACPRCSQAFDSFDGCFALTCSKQGCGCAFCAYCLADCGSNAHAHVAHCELNPSKGLFASADNFEQVRRHGRHPPRIVRNTSPDLFCAHVQRHTPYLYAS